MGKDFNPTCILAYARLFAMPVLHAIKVFFLFYSARLHVLGFAQHPNLLMRFSHEATDAHKAFNLRHAECRVPVEWAFGHVATLWSFADYHKNQKFLLQPVGIYYRLAVLLRNMHVCIYGSEIADYFNTKPPQLEDYLHLH